VPTPTTNSEGQTLLRIDWDGARAAHVDSTIIAEFLASAELAENVTAKGYVDQVGIEEAEKACRKSFDRLIRTWREEQRITPEEKKLRLKKKRKGQRRKKKLELRREQWDKHADIRARYGGDDAFLTIEQTSGDETCAEESNTTSDGSRVRYRNREYGRVERIPYRSAENEEAIELLDNAVEVAQGNNARHHRTQKHPPRANLPTPAQAERPLPASTHKWMVARRYKDRYEAAVRGVHDNKRLTEEQLRDSIIQFPNQWGRDPGFELVEAGASVVAPQSQSQSGPSRGESQSSIMDMLDPRLGGSQLGAREGNAQLNAPQA